ncbi:MAG: Small ribosomal subunit biogenesis GTPase RsgA [Haliscomenobacter sp.]|jgi:ribosome biogenesis GTPase|nr:Small ribosomal subunit biogenesis GTPase RsgA [Haliscomenobacter sp.]
MRNGHVMDCRITGKFRQEDKNLTNPVAVGDEVVIQTDPQGDNPLIKEILPRRNYVLRQSPRRKRDLHLLASNVDQAMLITTVVSPNLKPGFIDRFLLMTEPFNIPAVIVFNKADVYDDDAFDLYAYMEEVYQEIGYRVVLTSALNRIGTSDLRQILEGKTTLVSGQSGVGKTSLINAIEPQLQLRTQTLSDYSGKGQHTTTFAEMFPLSFGGYIIDTPGIKTLGFTHLEPLDVAHNFREFFRLSEECRFGGQCLHRNEPGCAVKAALKKEEVSEFRYMNYLNILEEIDAQNYWERHKEV